MIDTGVGHEHVGVLDHVRRHNGQSQGIGTMRQAAPAIRPLVEEAAAAAGAEARAERVTLAPPAGDRGMGAGAHRASGGVSPDPP